MYTIREMSEKTGLPASTIRYYEEIGLLENVVHKDGYHRMYDDSHLERMAAIECFKRARLPLEEIKQFFEYEKDICRNSERIVEMMQLQEQRTKAEITSLQVGLYHIQKKIRYYSAVDEAVQAGKELPKWCEVIQE